MRTTFLGHQLDDLKLPVRLLKRAHHDVENVLKAHVVMKTDVIEHDDDYTVTAELPGFDKDALTVKYADEWLTIRAKRAHNSDGRYDDGRILHRERLAADMTRQFHLKNVQSDQIQAHYAAGLLTVTLPKKVADSDGSIEIQ